MKHVTPYLFFNGRCQEALDYYSSVFNGKVTMRTTFGQAPQAISGVDPTHIMHAEFEADGLFFMASDGMESPLASHDLKDNPISLNIHFDNETEQKATYEALCEKGEILMVLQETFWGAKFAQVKDPFGIKWMLNFQVG